MADGKDPPPHNKWLQRAADFQDCMTSAHRRLLSSHESLVDRLLDISEHGTKEDTVRLAATKDALDRIDSYYAALRGAGSADENRSATPDEIAEAREIVERLAKK
jgi:hypothetical protein